MAQKLEFYLLESNDYDDFCSGVQAKLDDGWLFHGTVFVFPDYVPGPKVERVRYIQAFIKFGAEMNRTGFAPTINNVENH